MTGDPTAEPSRAHYAERLTVPWYAWLLCLLFGLGVAAVSLAVLAPTGVLVALVVSTALAGVAAWRVAAVVEVSDGQLRAGRARIALRELGTVTVLDRDAALRLRGRDINPAAFHLLRSWVTTAVRVEIIDPQDPTPYWYVATRRPHRLAAALGARPAPPRTDSVR